MYCHRKFDTVTINRKSKTLACHKWKLIIKKEVQVIKFYLDSGASSLKPSFSLFAREVSRC